MAEYQVPTDSLYYYGLDSTYKYTKPEPKPKPESKPAVEFELDIQGMPVRVTPEPRGLLNLPRSVNTNLAAYDEGVTLPGVGSAGNAGSGGQGIDPKAPAYIAPLAPQTPKTTPPAEPPKTRDVEAPDGSGAKGTQMSPKIDLGAANTLLKGLNIGEMADVNSFLSEQLPVSPGEKQGQGKQTSMTNDEFILQAQAGGYLDDFMGGTNDEAILHAQNAGFTPAVVVEGSSTPGEIGATPADTADNTRSVSVPGEEVAADNKNSGTNWGVAQPKSFDRARRDAFLNLDNRGYSAIRAADAATGRFRQGDKYFYNVGGELQEVNEDTYRQGQHRQLSADELKSGYVEGIKSTLVPVDQPDVTNPDTTETSAETPQGTTVGVAAGTTVDTDDTEFNINNEAPGTNVGTNAGSTMKDNYFKKGDDE